MTTATVPGSPGASPVPGFLAKLWALVEDPGSDDVISWSRNGQNFCILDEQRFAKELLPKYFKHNNLSSFIRQLNIYGFRKVIALENGMMTSDRSCAIEFQHPYFKRGKANLLANIKRKVLYLFALSVVEVQGMKAAAGTSGAEIRLLLACLLEREKSLHLKSLHVLGKLYSLQRKKPVSAVRAEDLKVCPDELHKVLSEVQEMREQQNNMDLKLANMRRENKALWKEVASLRQKHSQQQQLLSKILEFILGLMRGNCILGLKRKRPLTDASGGSPSKYSRSYVRIPVENCETAAISEHSPGCEDSIIIRDITDAQGEEEEEEEEGGSGTDRLLALAHTANGNREAQTSTGESIPAHEGLRTLEHPQSYGPVQLVDAPLLKTNAVELHPAQAGTGEDPAAVIDSILSENQPVAQSDSLLDREEIQDFLNCIDASLEELQAMLSGKKFNYASDTITDTFNPELPVLDMNLSEAPAGLENVEGLPGSPGTAGVNAQESSGKNDMQLIQYRGNPLLSLFEDPPSSETPGKLEEAKDVLAPAVEESGKISQQLLDLENHTSGATPLDQSLGPPLIPEDTNGEYKLFPLLLLSPVANFIEEASEIDTS